MEFVEDKWDSQGPYVRSELEPAMREFLGADSYLAEAERLLREHLQSQGLSFSTDAVPSTLNHGDTVKLGHRVNAELKDEFAAMAKKHYTDSLGAVLARAMNAYRGGGRRRRILDNVQHLVTGGTNDGTTPGPDENSPSSDAHTGTTGAAIESAGGTDESRQTSLDTAGATTADGDESVTPDPQLVMEIADDLGDQFPANGLASTIATTAGGDAATIDAYRDAVTNYKNVVKHPHKSLYIPEAKREEWTLWCDLNRETRATRLRRLAVVKALGTKQQRHALTYKQVQQLFEEYLAEGPSHDYACTLLELAANAEGFTYGSYQGQKQLRVNVKQVKQSIIDHALEIDASLDPDQLTVDGLITSYTASQTTNPEATADD
jgi:hypothetical protein